MADPTSLDRPRSLSGRATFGVYAGIAAVLAVAGYFEIFTQFAGYDDHGSLLITIKAFVQGNPMYADVYSPYGPFYYELYGAFFGLTGLEVTNNAGGLLSLASWVGASVLFGLAGQRISGRLIVGVATTLVAFGVLTVIANEPMHPQVVVAPLFGAIALVVASRPEGGRRAGVAIGLLLGALVLTKVNIGSLAVAGFVVAAFLTVEPLYRLRPLRLVVVAGFILLPLLLTTRDLDTSWGRELVALELFSTIAVLIAAGVLRPPSGEAPRGIRQLVPSAAAGLVASFFLVFLVMLITGTSPGQVIEDTVVETWRIARYLTVPFNSPAAAPNWGIAAVAAAALAIRLRGREPGQPSVWPGLGRLAAGLAIWFTISSSSPVSIGPSGNLLALPMVLVWVAALPPRGLEETPGRRFMRAFFCFFALSAVLQIYPVAGSQVGVAAVTFVMVGALCISDGIRQVQAWGATIGAEMRWRAGAATAAIAIAVTGVFAYNLAIRPLTDNAVLYSEQTALELDGADLFHIRPELVDQYTTLTNLVRENECTSLIGYPGVNSLYLWTGLDSPVPIPPGAWVILFDEDLQRRTLDNLRDSPRPCAVRNQSLAEEWLQGNPPREGPLVDFILDEMEVVSTIGDYEFLVPAS